MKSNLPRFKYHPDPIATGSFRELDGPVICPCCKKETSIIYAGPFYSINNVENLCPYCIASGAAAEKFSGEFQDSESVDEVSDPAKLEELTQRTPGYCGWQQEYWRAHCDDYCAYLGTVGYAELEELGLADEIRETLPNDWYSEIFTDVTKDGSIAGYLFQCLHCGKRLLHIDCD
ncbi:MAG: CbrC family protein [Oscillospiraceae bacterium]|nr:CbrC family protein [Oscillospiraceae bacterium]